MKKLDLAGKRFNRWIILGEHPHRIGGNVMWEALCDCGSKSVVSGYDVTKEFSKSCGCLKSEKTIERSTKHGMTPEGSKQPKEYMAWSGMIQRCTNKNSKSWKNYGGRGIAVHPCFMESFRAFLDEVGLAPSPKHQVDRKDNNRGYEPGNIHWVTQRVNIRNRRSVKVFTFREFTGTMKEVCEHFGFKYPTFKNQVNRSGKSPEEAAEYLYAKRS